MDLYLSKTPSLFKKFSDNLIWDIPNKEKKIYLTFDDGPTLKATQWILKILKKQEIKATFFCIGKNVKKHPELFKQIQKEGHTVGNHTYNHKNGWKTPDRKYLQNVITCKQTFKSTLFRPPYGRITPTQLQAISKQYHIIMWDVLSGDFDVNSTPEKCYQNIISNTTEGSIIVCHDSVKAFKNLKGSLEKSILYLKNKGFVFDVIQ